MLLEFYSDYNSPLNYGILLWGSQHDANDKLRKLQKMLFQSGETANWAISAPDAAWGLMAASTTKLPFGVCRRTTFGLMNRPSGQGTGSNGVNTGHLEDGSHAFVLINYHFSLQHCLLR